MLSIVFGLLTATCFATGTLVNSRTIRVIGNYSVLAWIMMIGFVITIPFVVVAGVPANLGGTTFIWWVISGVGNVGGLLFAFYALRVGKVGIVAPILACEGAIAATISALMGEPIGVLSGVILIFIVAGVVVSGVAPDPAPIAHERPVQAVLWAVLGAASFGISLFATGHLSTGLPIAWLLLPARLAGVLLIAIPLIATRRLRFERRLLPLLIIGGLAEVFGFTAYSIGAQYGVAVTSVLASQFGTIGAVAAYLLFKERLGRQQIIGVVMLVVGVAALTLAGA